MTKDLFDYDSRKPVQVVIKDFCEHVLSNSADYSSSKVLKVFHYKLPTSVEHEFLVADIFHKDKIFQLRIERSTGRKERWWHHASSLVPAVDYISRWQPSNPNQINLRAPQLKRSFGEMLGDTTNSVMGRKPDEFLEISSLRVVEEPFALLELCIILQFATEKHRQYDIKRYQCYWFCWVVLKLLEVELQGAIAIHRGKYFNRAGTYRNLIILDRQSAEAHLDEIRTELDNRASSSVEKIKKAFENAMNKQEVGENGSSSIMKRVQALVRFHREEQEKLKVGALKTWNRVARQEKQQEDWNTSLSQMSAAKKAFALASRRSVLQSDTRVPTTMKDEDWEWNLDPNASFQSPNLKQLAAQF